MMIRIAKGLVRVIVLMSVTGISYAGQKGKVYGIPSEKQIFKIVTGGSVQSVEQLLNAGVPPALKCGHNKQPLLSLAARNGHLPVCQLLLHKRADVQAVDNEKDTPLHAVTLELGILRKRKNDQAKQEVLENICKRLVREWGANPFVQNDDGYSAISRLQLYELNRLASELRTLFLQHERTKKEGEKIENPAVSARDMPVDNSSGLPLPEPALPQKKEGCVLQ